MHGPAAQHVEQLVAVFLEPQSAIHFVGMVLGHRQPAVVAQKIGRVQHVDVQGVALDPFAAVQQPPQPPQFARHLHAQRRLERMHRAHLVRHRTDAADAGRDVGHVFQRAAAQQRFEQPRRLEDVELHRRRFVPLLKRMRSAPSPSTRVIASTRIVRTSLMLSCRLRRFSDGQPVALGSKLGGIAVEAVAQAADQRLARDADRLKLVRSGSAGSAARTAEAAVTTAIVAGADRAAAVVRHRAQAGNALGHHHAHRAAPLALQAHAVHRRARAAPGQQRR